MLSQAALFFVGDLKKGFSETVIIASIETQICIKPPPLFISYASELLQQALFGFQLTKKTDL